MQISNEVGQYRCYIRFYLTSAPAPASGVTLGATTSTSATSAATTKKHINEHHAQDNNHNNHKILNENEKNNTIGKNPFQFVDLCGAPGGFSEYILHRFNKHNDERVCHGYGMSLKGENEDGKGREWDEDHLKDTALDTKNKWEAFYGEDGTGDIYNWDNVMKLRDVMSRSNAATYLNESQSQHPKHQEAKNNTKYWNKADLVVADGGFDAQRDSECQESLALRIVVCQTAASLHLLKCGGNFVIKMFGFQTIGIRKVMLHLYNTFEKVIFLKPVTSRPASAERYVICLNYDGLMDDDDDDSFDVLSWRNEILNLFEEQGSCWGNETSNNNNDFKYYHTGNEVVDCCLDSFDHNMLQLNIRSCSEIISCLNKGECECSRQIMDTDFQDSEVVRGLVPALVDDSFYKKFFQL